MPDFSSYSGIRSNLRLRIHATISQLVVNGLISEEDWDVWDYKYVVENEDFDAEYETENGEEEPIEEDEDVKFAIRLKNKTIHCYVYKSKAFLFRVENKEDRKEIPLTYNEPQKDVDVIYQHILNM